MTAPLRMHLPKEPTKLPVPKAVLSRMPASPASHMLPKLLTARLQMPRTLHLLLMRPAEALKLPLTQRPTKKMLPEQLTTTLAEVCWSACVRVCHGAVGTTEDAVPEGPLRCLRGVAGDTT